MGHGPEHTERRQHDNGLLIDDVDFVGDCPDRDTRAGGQDGGFRHEGVSGKGVDDRLRSFAGFFGGEVGGGAGWVVVETDGGSGQGSGDG